MNLGSSVTFDLPPRYTTTNGLVASFQQSSQRVHTLTVDQAANTSYAFSAQEFIFNVRDYMEKFGKSAATELGTKIEANVASHAVSAVSASSGPFRFFGNGLDSISSFGQLANMLAAFRNFGAAKDNIKVYLSDIAVPQIVNTGLNQFTPKRNDEMANSWEVGNWSGVDFYQSNLLPIHTAGTVGDAGTTLTLVSTNDPTGANITQLTFSGASASDANAIKAGDLLQFQDGVSGKPNMRFLTFIGHVASVQSVQIRATADAASDGSGNVTISITPALCSVAGNANQNLNNALQAGMQVKALPSHHAGLIVGGNALYLAMPKLPEEVPFPTANKSDPDTGVSMRMYYGSLFGQNQSGFVNDAIWGATLVPEYCMRIAFPLTQ